MPQLTSAEIRSTLVDALQLDLVGPTPADLEHAEEVLIQAPSKWYLTGFLAPFGAKPDDRSDPTADETSDEIGERDSSEDSQTPEAAAARKALFPSSMGLSFLISQQTKELQVTIHWGDYLPIELEEDTAEQEPDDKKKRKPQGWKRLPQTATLMVAIAAPKDTTEDSFEIEIPGGSGLALVVNARPIHDARFTAGTLSVSIFVVNYRKMQFSEKDTTFAFQTCLVVQCEAGFVPRSDLRGVDSDDWDEAVASLQYRHDYEFAVGHNVSALAHSTLTPSPSPIQGEGDMKTPAPFSPSGRRVGDEGKMLCTQVCTTWIPTANVPRVEPAPIADVKLGMKALADAESAAVIQQMLSPMVAEYRTWITAQRDAPIASPYAEKVAQLLNDANRACDRIEAGLQALNNATVLEAFRIANRVIEVARRRQLSQDRGAPPDSFDPPEWRPFQLAFILLNLVSIAQPDHRDREIVDLLFFPTGGGKTEAYLGLAAFTLVLRRLKHPGIQSSGMSVLMRYTLRLLTLDQLERAARLICALELERQQDPAKLGQLPFEIGLWVGQSATPNRMGERGDKDEDSARERTLAFKRDSKSKPSPIPLERCPWCGEKFSANSFQLHPSEDAPKNLTVACVNRDCDFRSRNPLPILAVDEPIYRRLPCFVIATVDKFAALPWVGQTGALFGRVTHYNEGEGFYSAGDKESKGKRIEHYLPPPDLVIQDELHLISGPLGTMVGLYETAIDTLCSYTENDKLIRPKIIASTATVRRASRQIQALFGRSHVDIFPPPSPDRHDSFFARTDFEVPGRLYLGVAAQGRSLKVVLLRTYLALMAAAHKQYMEQGGKRNKDNPADPYMTLLGYFNSLRELGGSRRIVEDEVSSRLAKYGDRLRHGELVGTFLNRNIEGIPEELTSRVSTNKVASTKQRLAVPFHAKERAVDVALATNMISVGLDIVRLGLMVVLGQPKTAAEYIQATSRVGREAKKPGLVVTLLNVHRPRDRSHYERFQSWHNSFYRAVEATSVTPFSPRALDRGLAGVVVALARLSIPEMTAALGASNIGSQQDAIDRVVETIVSRAEAHSPKREESSDLRQQVRAQVLDLIDTWKQIADRDKRLQYQKEADLAPPLLLDASNPDTDKEPLERQKFKAYRSLREVEATVNLWVRDPYGMSVEDEIK